MHIIRDSSAMADTLAELADDTPKRLLQQRTGELAGYGTDLSDLACFVIVQPGDTLCAIEQELALPIAANAVDGTRFGDDDFTPSWEWILDHGGWFELVFILTDDGFGHVLFVPDSDTIDPTLRRLCRTYAEQAITPETD